jgi:predicted ATPase
MGSNDSVMHKTLDNLFKNKYDVFNSRHFIDKYVKEFGIADKIEFELSSDSYDCRIKIIKDNKELDLADIGYGLSQVLPIIINIGIKTLQDDIDGLEGNKHEERILIIEEPETNLHPALQSKLADMFVECYKEYNIQLIIETHSEYLIRRLQYLTAKKEINPDFTQIYYFHPPDNVPKGETQIKKINLLKDGRLSTEFGSGFFDESTKIMESIWEARNLN